MCCIIEGDCVKEMGNMKSGCVELVFADPPFNIGYKYDVYEDNKSYRDYVKWSEEWASQVKRILKPNGSFWLAIGDAFASDLDVLMRREIGFHRRSWVVWHYTFGVNCANKFTPSHAHLFHYVSDPEDFTFNADAIKVKSARQAIYGDKRAKGGGRIPDDTWVLRPQDSDATFSSESDAWYIPRLCGTHKERVGWHPCQMPLALMERIIRVSSNTADIVLDPFAGSGTTIVAAKKLGRIGIGIEMSEQYAAKATERVRAS